MKTEFIKRWIHVQGFVLLKDEIQAMISGHVLKFDERHELPEPVQLRVIKDTRIQIFASKRY